MVRIQIYDTTLRDGEQTPGVHFGVQQKYDIAKRLARTGVDIIEAGFPASSHGDFEAIRQIACGELLLLHRCKPVLNFRILRIPTQNHAIERPDVIGIRIIQALEFFSCLEPP